LRDHVFDKDDFIYTVHSPTKAGECEVFPFLPPDQSYSKNGWMIKTAGRSEVSPSDGHRPTYYRACKVDVFHKPFRLTGELPISCVSPSGLHTRVKRYADGKAPIDPAFLLPDFTKSTVDGKRWYTPKLDLNLQARVRNKVLAEISKSEIDLGQTLGEVSQTANLLLSRSLQVASVLNSLRKGNVKDALGKALSGPVGVKKVRRSNGSTGYEVYSTHTGSPSDRLADTYLEVKYGWRPLLSDLSALADGVLSKLGRSDGFPILSVTRDGEESYSVSNLNPLLGYVDQYSGERVRGHKIGITYRVSDAYLQSLNSVGLINPLALGWELMPLSFAIDWFVNVGAFLRGLSAPIGLTYLHGYETRWAKSKITGRNTYVADQFDLYEGKYPFTEVAAFGFLRLPAPGFPIPSIEISLSMDLNKLATLMALTQQRL
jgi:hypothetical protein